MIGLDCPMSAGHCPGSSHHDFCYFNYISAQKETTTWDFEVYYEVIGRLRLKHRSRPARNADFSALFLACFFLIMFMHLVNLIWIRLRTHKIFSVIENDSSWGRLRSQDFADADGLSPNYKLSLKSTLKAQKAERTKKIVSRNKYFVKSCNWEVSKSLQWKVGRFLSGLHGPYLARS